MFLSVVGRPAHRVDPMTHDSRFEALLGELEAWAGECRQEVCVGLGDSMPTVHGFPTVDEGLDRAAHHRELESRGRSKSATSLGLDGHVFYWLGSAPYTHPDVIFIWDPQADAAGALIAPWDTGGLISVGPDGRGRDADEACRLLVQYSLPPSLARRYLAHVLVACFRQPADYVAGVAPRPGRSSSQRGPWYPGRVDYAEPQVDSASHTFELRTPAPVPIDEHLAAIVVDPSKLDSKRLRELRQRAKPTEYGFVSCRGSERPYQRARRLVDEMLRDSGVLR